MKNYLFFALGLGFLVFGFSAYQQSQPSVKSDRVYTEIKKYSPYYLKKRFGGLLILNKEDEAFKEKPLNIKVFKRLDQLEKAWGKAHLHVDNSTIEVQDKEHKIIATIPLINQEEITFIHQYFGI